MAYNKIIVNGEVKIDLTADTVDASHLVSGYTAHVASGEIVTGTLIPRTRDDLSILGGDCIEIPAGVYDEPIVIRVKAEDSYFPILSILDE